ncbi:hypothetical protein A0K93_03440 [Corynebacterium sp. BCW_4722]|nr:hypothetical protein A0K93_03440 [Corynebacterium sp. BCW_4722]
MLTIAFVTGTEPGKWFRRYESPLTTIPSDDPFVEEATLALMRLPDPRVTDDYHVVRLYDEAAGVAVPKDSIYVGERPTREDLSDEIVNFSGHTPIDDLRSALQVVAANVGIAYAPLPLLKNLAKKQVVPVELDAEPETHIALVWKKDDDSDAVQDFVGVAKGRTARSSRGSKQTLKTAGKHEKTKPRQHKGSTRNHPRSGGRKRRS